ncbi:cation:proton antiporter [Candidatus Woesearchaeota archaeon]|nr:cation:proton antiporter [Candidatus Woesearchaeota archaeon]
MTVTSIFIICAALFAVLILVTLLRIIIGPTAPDRVVALDTINTIIVAGLLCLSAGFRTVIYIDIALVYAMLSFVSTLYIAKYLGEQTRGAAKAGQGKRGGEK